MNNEKHLTIHDHEFQLIGDFFKDLLRQGPSCPCQTSKALDFCGELQEIARIADLGCGTGGQTLQLARQTGAHITAIDLMPVFTHRLRQQIAGTALAGRITVIDGSMDELPFDAESLDLIWSEGAVASIGFEKGLDYWRRFLKPGGYVAVSEATWFTTDPPAEIAEFWNANYPEINTVPVKVAAMERLGYLPVAHFIMPEACWWNYLTPVQENCVPFLERHRLSTAARALVSGFKYEKELYERYKECYGYAFYIGRKM